MLVLGLCGMVSHAVACAALRNAWVELGFDESILFQEDAVRTASSACFVVAAHLYRHLSH